MFHGEPTSANSTKKHDLIDILVPYFKSGLESNESCMWITFDPLTVEDAENSLREAVKNLDEYIHKGQIGILDYRQWYTNQENSTQMKYAFRS
jgi:hypothetical protein